MLHAFSDPPASWNQTRIACSRVMTLHLPERQPLHPAFDTAITATYLILLALMLGIGI